MDCLLYAKHTGAAMVCRTNMVPVPCLVGETDALIRHHNKLGGDSRVLEKHLRGRFYPGLEPGKASWRKWPLSYSWIMCWIKPDTECCRVERGKELDFQTTVSTKAHSEGQQDVFINWNKFHVGEWVAEAERGTVTSPWLARPTPGQVGFRALTPFRVCMPIKVLALLYTCPLPGPPGPGSLFRNLAVGRWMVGFASTKCVQSIKEVSQPMPQTHVTLQIHFNQSSYAVRGSRVYGLCSPTNWSWNSIHHPWRANVTLLNFYEVSSYVWDNKLTSQYC